MTYPTILRPAAAALAALLAGTAVPALAAEPQFSAPRLSDEVRVLASDAFEGRAPASAGETKTVDYLVAQFKAAGLQPGGSIVAGKRGWTQDVPLLKTRIAGAPTLSLSIAGTPQPLTQGEEIAVRAALTGQRQVALASTPLVFCGYGISAPERGWDDFKGVDLQGKIMVVLVNDPDFDGPIDGVDFGGKAMTYYGRWTYKYEEAARRGAAGVLVVHETAPASYGWATVRNSNTNVMFDIVRADPPAAHTGFEGWIQRSLAERLASASGQDFDQLKAAARRRDFRPVPLAATLDARYAVDVATITSHNVLARMPGASRPGETLIYSAHWDHLGIGEPDAKGDRIYNGAVDNGTGTAALIEVARAFAAGPRPARSVVFLAVTAEERGLLGSEYYAANPVYPLATTVADINMDALGVAGPARNVSISGSAKLELLDMLIAEAQAAGKRFSPDPHPQSGSFYRSDHFSFAKRGVPAVSFESGDDLVTGGKARGDAVQAAYTDAKYHQPADEWSPALDFSGIADDLPILYALGRRLADGQDWPGWDAASEFAAARNATAAERRQSR